MRKTVTFAALALAALVVTALAQQARVTPAAEYTPGPVALLPTEHPAVSRDLNQLWFVPSRGRAAISRLNQLVVASELNAKGEYAKALPDLLLPASQEGPLGIYAMYDAAVAQLNLGQTEEAARLFKAVSDRRPIGYLADAALLGQALCADITDPATSVPLYEQLLASKASRQEEILWRLGNALRAAGQTDRATAMFTRVYYEFPLSEFAAKAALDLETMRPRPPLTAGSERYTLELARAERLFAAREYAPARTAFTSLKPYARGGDRELVDLRIAETDYFLKRPRDARDGLRPLLTSASRKAEVLYFQALTLRDLRLAPEYRKTVRQVADEFPGEHWAEDVLNNYASYLIVEDEDDEADAIFRELYKRNPKGPYAERASWKIGWRAFLQEKYAETVTFFERGASEFPRSDYRPAWIYWAGRAHEALDEQPLANERFALVADDYLNSYYGRLAVKRLGGKQPTPRVVADQAIATDAASPAPAHTALIRSLVAAGLYSHAVNELRYAQKVTGDSPAIQATLAWISHEQGLEETGQERFTLFRGAITGMRRAYPQFLAAGGEQLPREVLTVIFPLEYWQFIKKYSDEQGLDPYLMSALVAQESQFAADVRSSANAYGLMQLLPSTARQQARKLDMTYSAQMLTDPESNIRMGMNYFAEKVAEFGAVHLALASYNAGESPVHRWMAERPTLGVEEFIDDIPYPETQNYVKRILGTAEDYRRLYKDQ